MRSRSDCLWEVMPFAAMVVVVCLDVVLTTLSKAAMDRGMSHFVFVFYSNAFATLILLPSSFIFHRHILSHSLTFSLLCRFFTLSLIGITLLQNCVFTGINYSSPTLGSAMSNLNPAFTFILALIFRMEIFDVRSTRSQIKIMGTLISISGALIVTLYKGPSIGMNLSSPLVTSREMLPPTLSLPSNHNSLTSNNWILGGLFLATASLSSSIWQIFQTATVKRYPAEMVIVSFNSFFATIQCLVVSLMAERDPNAWKLTPDLELISIFYSAVIGSVITPSLQTWCLHKKGPVFVAMFTPVGIGIATILGVIFLGDTLHLGSLVGAAIIILGFYGVIWGQSKEEKDEVEVDNNRVDGARPPSPSSTHTAPLLRNHREV
ncbi:Drug/metabolite transporter [Macleaya cordata]|uniref:WAT1-related protein n=1 Tax=Macleaya cordata TaxID=56857 RepID=A0A200R0P7_MACCD|nr:Drug/metabolite transporter [Macleaya cordata]